jgi:hypothetical protein
MLNSFVRPPAVFVAALLMASGAPQQKQEEKPAEDVPSPTIRVQANVVNVLAAVRDKRGGLISNLSKRISLSPKMAARGDQVFPRETDVPLTIVCWLTSAPASAISSISSARPPTSSSRSAAQEGHGISYQLREEASVAGFTGSARLLRPGSIGCAWLGSQRRSSRTGTHHHPRGTVLYDAVYLAASDRLSHEVDRKPWC